MTLDLNDDEVEDLLKILGGAKGLFSEEAEKIGTMGIFKALFRDYAKGSERFIDKIVKAANQQRPGL